MITLSDFLLARLAEDEVDALAAGSPRDGVATEPTWRVDEENWLDVGVVVDSPENPGLDGRGVANVLGTYRARHIARWDPARALAEVAALRQVVDLHRQVECVNCVDRGRGTGTSCLSCHHDDEMGLTPRYDGTCATLRTLAGAWAHHPDFNPLWGAT